MGEAKSRKTHSASNGSSPSNAEEAGREPYEAQAVAAWRNIPFKPTTDDAFALAVVDAAKRALVELKRHRFRAWLDRDGVLLVGDDTERRRPAPDSLLMGFDKIVEALEIEPGLIDAVWPPDAERRSA